MDAKAVHVYEHEHDNDHVNEFGYRCRFTCYLNAFVDIDVLRATCSWTWSVFQKAMANSHRSFNQAPLEARQVWISHVLYTTASNSR